MKNRSISENCWTSSTKLLLQLQGNGSSRKLYKLPFQCCSSRFQHNMMNCCCAVVNWMKIFKNSKLLEMCASCANQIRRNGKKATHFVMDGQWLNWNVIVISCFCCTPPSPLVFWSVRKVHRRKANQKKDGEFVEFKQTNHPSIRRRLGWVRANKVKMFQIS